jgi:hypothetical protein
MTDKTPRPPRDDLPGRQWHTQGDNQSGRNVSACPTTEITTPRNKSLTGAPRAGIPAALTLADAVATIKGYDDKGTNS